MAIPGIDGVISAGLSSDLMRLSIENKSLLDTKGSLYVGTSNNITIRDNNNIPITKKLSAPEQQYAILAVENGDLVWKKITPVMVGSFPYVSDFTGMTVFRANQVSLTNRATIVTYTEENTEVTIESRLQSLKG